MAVKKNKIILKKNLFLPLYYEYLNDFSKDEIYFGSRNSGKSYFVYQKMIKKAMQEPTSVTLFVREFKNSIKNSVFKGIKNLLIQWKLFEGCSVNNTELTITLPNGALLLFSGLDNIDSLKSLPILTRIMYEEADALANHSDEFYTLQGSLRDTNKKNEINTTLCFNPPRVKDFFIFHLYMEGVSFEELYKKKVMELPNCRIFHTTWRDNKFADQKRLAKQYENLKEKDFLRWCRDSEGMLVGNDSEDCIFKMRYVDFAIANQLLVKSDDKLVFGLDLARFGNDRTILTPRIGNKVLEQIEISQERGYDIACRVLQEITYIVDRLGYCNGKIELNIDATGLGASCCDSLYQLKKEKKYRVSNVLKVNEINFSNKAIKNELYGDIISESAFALAELLEDKKVQLPNNKQLVTEMSQRLKCYDSRNRECLEQKKIFKKRQGYSPDRLDSLILCFIQRKSKLIFI